MLKVLKSLFPKFIQIEFLTLIVKLKIAIYTQELFILKAIADFVV